ncbi:peroxisomal biogenesis factor 19 [Fusarium subglutinans]|uniref:Peroxisomal biogenesis factor 19 n=1 Tax=Gibberella subglutinans TaxID=42677 RepID=A0A8H5US06_GIBSU|nr:peroxisomal biogenesis factor 19 [Fusarium subglutinans]KAF5597241.1 peroxisomal biogenesis factor 19 [Fusarium subglutinans]
MGVDKDTEVALKEEVTEGLKEVPKEGVKDEVKEDKKDENEDNTDLKTEAETDADAATSSHTLMPDAPTTHTPASSLAIPSLDSKPQNAASHEVSAGETAPDDANPQDLSPKAAPQQPVPQEAVATTEAVAEKTDALPTPASKAPITVDEMDEVPDPDEDDLDDLDDMLEEFSAVKLDQTKPLGAAAASIKPEAPNGSASGKQPEVEDAFSEDEFARQLQAGMADLLGELEQSPDMQAQFEDIFKHIAAAEGAGDAPPPNTSKGPSSQAPPEDASFQDTIKRTMERMQASGDQATAAAASGSADDFMSEMLKQLSSGDLGDLGGDGSEEEFSKMLMGMMEQLTNKEILYEPMKELDEKFPEWLIKNRDSTPKDDLKRYEEQQSIVREIVAKFEEKTYSDSNAADREFIVDKMQKMQAAGSPPSDLVGDMQSAQDALNPGDEACNPQ